MAGERLRIGVLAYEFPRGPEDAIVSGEVKNPYSLVEALRSRGHLVSVISVPYLTRTVRQDLASVDPGASTVDVPEGRLRGVLRTMWRVKNVQDRVEALISRGLDIVHAQGPALGLAAARANSGKVAGSVPVVTTAHGTNLPEADADRDGGLRHRMRAWNARLDLLVDRRGFAMSDAVVAVSHFQEREMREVYRVDPGKVHVIHNGVDLQRYFPHAGPRSSDPVVLFVGRLVPKKGLQHLIESLPDVFAAVPNARCVVVGGSKTFDTFGPRLHDLAERVGVAKNITWMSSVSEADLPDVYRSAAVAVFPSLNYESLPTVALEAMATGVPVVATRAWGSPEALGDDHPGLIAQGDHAGLTAAVIRSLTDESFRASVIADQRARVQEFSTKLMAERHERLYRGLLDV